MYKVVIADDEQGVRDAVIMLGNWNDLKLELAGEAADGDRLMELADENRPDIVITDMKMPGICGSELIRKLSEAYKDMKIIIISGFDDFEFTKQAITSKVVDYLMKPINEEHLNNALEKAVKEIELEKNVIMEKIGLEIKLNETRPYFEERLLNRFVNGQISSVKEFLNISEFFDLEKAEALYTVAIIVIENFQQICEQLCMTDFQLFSFTILNVLNELLNRNTAIAFKNEKMENEIVIIFSDKENKESLNLILEDIQDKLFKFFNANIFIGVGNSYTLHEDVKYSFQEARNVLMHMNVLKYKKIAFFEGIAGSLVMKNKKEKSLIYGIKGYIDENYMAKITLSGLARKFFWSEEYISKMFKKEFGVNLLEFIISLRINRSKQMLMEGMKIYDVAVSLSFTDESHFSKVFKKHTGISPKSFKENFLEGGLC